MERLTNKPTNSQKNNSCLNQFINLTNNTFVYSSKNPCAEEEFELTCNQLLICISNPPNFSGAGAHRLIALSLNPEITHTFSYSSNKRSQNSLSNRKRLH